MALCIGRTKAKKPCQREATHGEFCYSHNPETSAQAKRQNGRRGNAGKVSQRLGKRKIETHQDAARLLIDLGQAVLRGEVDKKDASTVGYLLHPILKSRALPEAPEAPHDALKPGDVEDMDSNETLAAINRLNGVG